MTRLSVPRMDATTIPDAVWLRAKQLRLEGLGSRRIELRLQAEGWPVVPTANILWHRMDRDQWPGPVLRHGPTVDEIRAGQQVRKAIQEARPDPRWLEATKRCEMCYGIGTGTHCPNDHPFPCVMTTEVPA